MINTFSEIKHAKVNGMTKMANSRMKIETKIVYYSWVHNYLLHGVRDSIPIIFHIATFYVN